jgi:hypothetical protein
VCAFLIAKKNPVELLYLGYRANPVSGLYPNSIPRYRALSRFPLPGGVTLISGGPIPAATYKLILPDSSSYGLINLESRATMTMKIENPLLQTVGLSFSSKAALTGC